jgi:hypothetical protein
MDMEETLTRMRLIRDEADRLLKDVALGTIAIATARRRLARLRRAVADCENNLGKPGGVS